jgi:uncharacterized DUF497 family protein
MVFEWDEEKNASNIRKNGVGFEEAAAVFLDPLLVEQFDGEHSGGEERWRAYGLVRRKRLLVVSYTRRNGLTRIISARKATKAEKEGLFLW